MVFSWEIPHSTGTIQWVFNISRVSRQAVNEAELATQQVLGEVEAREETNGRNVFWLWNI